MGGYFSLVYALAHPERVSRLVLIGEPAGSAPQVRLSHRLIGTRIINSALFETVLKPGPGTIRNGFENMLVADVSRVPSDYMDCMTAGSMIPGAAQSWITLNESVYKTAGAGLFAASSGLSYALRPELHNLAAPTLLLWGEKDTFGPPSLGQEMARLMPNGRCDVIPDAGHLAWMDQLDLCAEKIRTFLA
jgi:pimeloyl-ACP methyl ester carboxylesterase